jgi:hypothetical protein
VRSSASAFGSQLLNGALLDRLTQHVHNLELESYRLKKSTDTHRMTTLGFTTDCGNQFLGREAPANRTSSGATRLHWTALLHWLQLDEIAEKILIEINHRFREFSLKISDATVPSHVVRQGRRPQSRWSFNRFVGLYSTNPRARPP